MTPRKYKVFLAFFPYGGNGSAPSENPAIRNWFAGALLDLKTKHADKVESVSWKDFADTPITMTRNAAVLAARKANADILIMVDSDMVPDMYLHPEHAALDPQAAKEARPFIDVALEQIDGHYEQGPIVIGAPYCGPPPTAPVYVFCWEEGCQEAIDARQELRMFSRNEAAIMKGVGPAAALATGMIAYDMRAFNLIEPIPSRNGQDVTRGSQGFYYYEFDDHYHAHKGSTEDVTNTRDISFNGIRRLGYNPLLCAWDCWAGHVKPLVVGKPKVIPIEAVEGRYAQAVRDDVSAHERIDAERYSPPGHSDADVERDDLMQRIRRSFDACPRGSVARSQIMDLARSLVRQFLGDE
jgi:hypothetical protein